MVTQLAQIQTLIDAGRIRVGMTRKELFEILGVPDDEGGTSRKFKHPSIYKYGDVQFVFPQCRNSTELDSQGLLYVYLDEDSEHRDRPVFLLQGKE